MKTKKEFTKMFKKNGFKRIEPYNVRIGEIMTFMSNSQQRTFIVIKNLEYSEDVYHIYFNWITSPRKVLVEKYKTPLPFNNLKN